MKKQIVALSMAAITAAYAAEAPKAAPASGKTPAAISTAAAASAKPSAPAAASAKLPPVAASAAGASAKTEAAPANDNALPDIAATAYIVFDVQSKQKLGGREEETRIEPAALTKLMTAYLVFQALERGELKPDQMLTASERAWHAEGSRMFLTPNKPVAVSDLLKGMVVQSANDATITLAEALGGGTEAGFVKKMNNQARTLGMLDTTFQNATGTAVEGHLSTVADLAKLAAAVINDFPKYYPIFSMRSFSYNGIEQPNRNLLLYRDPSVDGMMTGHSPTAGYNLIASSNRNDRRIISVAVGMESPESRAAESSKLLNWGLQAFDTLKLYDANQVVSQVKVYRGSSVAANVGFANSIFLTIPHGEGQSIKPILETVQPVLAPIRKGQVLGKVKMVYQNKTLAQYDVVALNSVEEAGLWGRIRDNITLWWRSLFS